MGGYNLPLSLALIKGLVFIFFIAYGAPSVVVSLANKSED
jgi:hypothetical protein